MDVYNLSFKPSVPKDLVKLPTFINRSILKKIENLRNDPLPPGCTKLSGTDHFYRIRVGDYRVIYSVDHASKTVIVLYVRHRREVYRSF